MISEPAGDAASCVDEMDTGAPQSATGECSSRRLEAVAIGADSSGSSCPRNSPITVRENQPAFGVGATWAWADSARNYDWMDWHVLSTAIQWW
jgi:hypothetical protein